MKVIKTKIEINAPADKVWSVLVNFSDYSKWNPFIVSSEGNPIKGTHLINKMKNGDKIFTFKPVLKEVEVNNKLSWLGHLFIPGLFDGFHYFKIEEIETNKVTLEQGESFKGILTGMMMKSIGEQTRNGFIAMNNALKERVETLN